MNAEVAFAPIARTDARVLILGSMPGRRSLTEQQYYAHQQNAFWRIVQRFTGVAATEPYTRRVAGLLAARIAVWDVIHSCERPGSLDADINGDTIAVNDFERFYADHTDVHAVFFNGAKAASEYRRRVIPMLSESYAQLMTQQLLSTSPANARYSISEKSADWAAVGAALVS
ncbi:MAG: DNA-deoxyinosine glycosylase [Pseudomonadota bacterium]